MARYSLTQLHPTKINVFVQGSVWVAQHGNKTATAPFRPVRLGGRGEGVADMGRFDAIELLTDAHPELRETPYVVLER